MDVHRHGPKLSFQSIAGLDIKDLAVTWDHLEPGDVVNLGALSGLRRLVFWAGPANSVEAVGRLRKLEYLNLVGGRSGWARLAGLARLPEAVLLGARLPDPPPPHRLARPRRPSLPRRPPHIPRGI